MDKKDYQKVFNLLEEQHPDAKCELIFNSPYELLVAVILSAQCTDKRVNVATKKLFEDYNTPIQVSVLTENELKPYIFSCGFFNNKARNIINMSKKLVNVYNAVIPNTMEELLTLDGVGRKTASVVLAVAFDIPAMPVDTHVFRVSKRIGLSDGDNVLVVEKDLKEAFPMQYWNRLHHYLIFHGRYICKAQNPNCDVCMLSNICKENVNNTKK